MEQQLAEIGTSKPVDARSALKGFFAIMDLWQATTTQRWRILGEPDWSDFDKWVHGDPAGVTKDTLRRIGYVAGVFKALQIVYSDPIQADSWVHRSNRHFSGQSPMERMSAGDMVDLAAVRAYIDAARGPWS